MDERYLVGGDSVKLIDLALEEENNKVFSVKRDRKTIIKDDCPHRFNFYKNLFNNKISGFVAKCNKKTIDCKDCWNQDVKSIRQEKG